MRRRALCSQPTDLTSISAAYSPKDRTGLRQSYEIRMSRVDAIPDIAAGVSSADDCARASLGQRSPA